jgi:hypothetical protein
MARRSVLLVTLALAALSTGCATREVRNNRQINVLSGVAEFKQTQFAPPSPLTFSMTTREWSPNTNVSGNQVSLLWGLITYDDN